MAIRWPAGDCQTIAERRTLHDDLLDQGETCYPNRVACLATLAGITAQTGYKRRPGSYGGKPSLVVDNTLDRQFDVDVPDRAWVTDITTSGLKKVSPTSPSLSISTPAVSSAGQCRAGKRRTWPIRLCLWPYGVESRRTGC